MKKLNNRGFGLGTLLAFICFFIVVMLAIAIMAYNAGVNSDSSKEQEHAQENTFVSP